MKKERRNLRQDILDVASDMLGRYGYEGTTFQRIADALGITKGTITYHFKNKYRIMDILIAEFFSAVRDFVNSCPEEIRNTYHFHCIMYIYAYRVIMSDPRNIDLFYFEDQMVLWEQSQVPTLHGIYESITQDFHKTVTEDEITVMTFIDLGARRRLCTEFKNRCPLLLDIDQFTYYHIELIGTLCHLDLATIKENIAEAFAFANAHRFPVTTMLIRTAGKDTPD